MASSLLRMSTSLRRCASRHSFITATNSSHCCICSASCAALALSPTDALSPAVVAVDSGGTALASDCNSSSLVGCMRSNHSRSCALSASNSSSSNARKRRTSAIAPACLSVTLLSAVMVPLPFHCQHPAPDRQSPEHPVTALLPRSDRHYPVRYRFSRGCRSIFPAKRSSRRCAWRPAGNRPRPQPF